MSFSHVMWCLFLQCIPGLWWACVSVTQFLKRQDTPSWICLQYVFTFNPQELIHINLQCIDCLKMLFKGLGSVRFFFMLNSYKILHRCKATFSKAIIPVFSVTWPFRNHSNMIICCSRNISDYYQYWKHLSCFIFLWKLIHLIFLDFLINRK